MKPGKVPLRAIGDQIEWLAADGRPCRGPAAVYDGPAAALALASEQLLLDTVTLPGRARGRWRQAVPFALEERLADPVERLHVASAAPRPVGGGPPQSEIAVAAVDAERLRSQLERWRAAGLRPAALIPDVLLLPRVDDAWSALFDGPRCLLRSGPYGGFACEAALFPALLTQTRRAAAEPPRRIVYWGEPRCPLDGAFDWQRQPGRTPLTLFAAGLRQGPFIDLLQGEFAAGAGSGRGAARLRPWRWAALLAALWAALHLAGLTLDVWQLRQQRDDLEQDIRDGFFTAMPDASRLVDARTQLQSRLRELAGGASDDAFFVLLAAGAAGFDAVPGGAIEPLGLRFGDGRLEWLLRGSRLEDFDRLRAALAERADVRAELRTSKRDGRVDSRLSLSLDRRQQ